MSTARLRAKLLTAGYSDEEVESFDRQIFMEKWAELIIRGVDDPVPTSPQFTAYDVELKRDRLRWEQQKYEIEIRLRERELALKEEELHITRKLKEDELQMTRKLKEDELERQKQQIKN